MPKARLAKEGMGRRIRISLPSIEFMVDPSPGKAYPYPHALGTH